MKFICNPSFAPVLRASPDIRYIHLRGGRGRGGSFFATDYALAKLAEPVYFRAYLMRAVYGDIRGSLWRDLMDRMTEKEDRGELRREDFIISDAKMTITHRATNNTIGSKGFRKSSGGQTARLKSLAGATHVIIEEFEEIEEEDFDQLDISLRTLKGPIQLLLIFNPPKKNHWIHTRWYTLKESRIEGYYIAEPKPQSDFLSVFSTYHNNIMNVPQSFVNILEAFYHSNIEYYYTVIRGLVSEGVKGRIYRGWKAITRDEFNELPYPSYYVLDFGFSNDPLALAEVKRHNRKRYAKELIYERELTNSDLIQRLRALRIGNRPIIADSAEPKSIRDLRNAGFNVIAARKGPDTIRFGIKVMQGLEWHYTDDSANLIYEYQEYKWDFSPDKEQKDTPVPKHDHIMDGLRYGEITDPWGGGGIVVHN